MKNLLFIIFLLFSLGNTKAQSKKICFQTPYGDIKIILYDFTPNHRDLMMNSIKDSIYQEALFNRIIKNFVVQGGEHDDDIHVRERANPSEIKPRLAAEFDDRAFHKIGAIGAGRDDNTEKASFLNQIYFVVGKNVSTDELDRLELSKGVVYNKKQRESYLLNGGLPRLDKDYTVFGEIYEGLNVIMEISQLETDSLDYPLKSVPFRIIEIQK